MILCGPPPAARSALVRHDLDKDHREHGDQAKDRNLEVFRTVIEVLRAGGCLGFAPEGVSRFLPYMEQPFKTGVARRGPAAANAARPWPATQPLRLALGSRAISQPLPPPPLVQRAAVRALLSQPSTNPS